MLNSGKNANSHVVRKKISERKKDTIALPTS
jgi:hypothetical protein